MKLKTVRRLKSTYSVVKKVVKTTLVIPVLALAIFATLEQGDKDLPPSNTDSKVELPATIQETKRGVIPREIERLPEKPIENPKEEVKPETIQEYSKRRVIEVWGVNNWNSFNELVKHESGWKSTVKNKNSTAYGLGQFLDSTWKGTGIKKTSDPKLQIEAMIIYIGNRYKTPNGAWEFWKINKYY